jgi:hypothetical protein
MYFIILVSILNNLLESLIYFLFIIKKIKVFVKAKLFTVIIIIKLKFELYVVMVLNQMTTQQFSIYQLRIV